MFGHTAISATQVSQGGHTAKTQPRTVTGIPLPEGNSPTLPPAWRKMAANEEIDGGAFYHTLTSPT